MNEYRLAVWGDVSRPVRVSPFHAERKANYGIRKQYWADSSHPTQLARISFGRASKKNCRWLIVWTYYRVFVNSYRKKQRIWFIGFYFNFFLQKLGMELFVNCFLCKTLEAAFGLMKSWTVEGPRASFIRKPPTYFLIVVASFSRMLTVMGAMIQKDFSRKRVWRHQSK